MSAVNLHSHFQGDIWIQEKYASGIESSRNGGMTLRRRYQLRKKQGSDPKEKTSEMDEAAAYGALQSFVMQNMYSMEYTTNEGTVRLWVASIKCDVEKNNYPVYQGEVTWEFDPKKPDYILQPVTWSHRMVSGTRVVTFPHPSTVQRYYPAPGVPPIPYTGINWDNQKGYEGVECYSPEWRITAKQQLLASLVTMNYLRTLIWMTPTVNMYPFLDLPPGTVLYLGADVEETIDNRRNKIANLTHQFVVAPNMMDFTFDGIYIDRKWGHEYGI